jgi:hypothetical protein
MENGVIEGDTPIGQTTKWKMAWEQVVVMVNGCQMLEYLKKIVIPAETREEQVCKHNIPMGKQAKLSVLNYISKQMYTSAMKSIITAKITIKIVE